MFCVDSSSFIAFFGGDEGEDVEMLAGALSARSISLPPPVIAELLSNPSLKRDHRSLLARMPLVELTAGFWERAGLTRSDLLRRKFKPKLADTLIAQSCIDANWPLIARDQDYVVFAQHAGLRLLP